MATNATYKRYNGSGWEIFYFKTSAGQVGVTSTRKFITSSTTVNGQPFQLAANDSNAASVTIGGNNISCGISQNLNYIATTESVAEALADLDTACKAAYDHVPVNVLTTDSQLDVSKLVGVIPEANLPDYILGQLMYGGTLGSSHTASLSSKAKAKLGVTANTLELVNSNGTSTPNTFTSNEGIYYIVTVTQTFASLELNVGDWLVATSSGWKKVDNTDAIASWCGLTGNITTAQAKTALGGSIANGNTGFATGGDVYAAVTPKLQAASGLTCPGGGASYWWNVGVDSVRGFYFREDENSETAGFIGFDNNEFSGAVYLSSPNGVVVNSNSDNLCSAILKTDNLGQSTVFQFPDDPGTLALREDIPTVNNSTVTIQKNGSTVDSFTLNQSSNKSINITISKSDVGLGNVDNTSDASKKSSFTGSIASGNAGFVTGGAAYTALAGKLDSVSDFRKYGGTQYAWYVGYDTWRGVSYYFDGDDADHPDFCGFIGMNTDDWGNEIIIQATEGLVITTTNDIQDRTGAVLMTTNLTDKYTVQFPDKGGTLAMTSDIPTFTISTSQPSNPKVGDVWIDTDA